MIPYCVFALQRRSYRRGNKVSGFFCSSRPDRSLRKGGGKGGANFGRQGGRTTAKANSITPAHRALPGVPSKKRFPPFFRKKRGRRIFIVAKSREGRVPKKVQSLFFFLLSTLRGATTMLHTCGPSALDLDNDNNQVQALRTHSSAKVSPTSSSSSLLFRLLPIQTFHHPREEGRRMPFQPPPR